MIVGMGVLSACGGAHELARPRVSAQMAFAPDPAAVDRSSYWHDISLPLTVGTRGPSLPAQEADVERALGASSKWAALSDDAKQRALAAGVVLTPLRPAQTSIGGYYDALDEQHVPYVVTMDVFFSLARACVGSALDEAERALVSPALPRVITGLLARLGAERPSARVDLRGGYDIAMSVLAVAASLLDPATPVPDDLKHAVSFELDRIRGHVGIAESQVLGRPLDYATFDAHQGLVEIDARLGQFRAVRWLGYAALVLARRSESARGIDVAEMRSQTRAALLIARALKADAQLTATWSRVEDVLTLVYGPPDDLGVRELVRLAKNSGVDVSDGQSLANVAAIDRVRRAAASAAPAYVMDLGPAPLTEGEAAPATFRLLGPSATPDAIVLGQLVAPRVGRWSKPSPDAADHPSLRTLPSALDVGVLLGSKEARLALTENGDDSYAGFGDALAAATNKRMPDDTAARHTSVSLSYLDAIATYLGTSAADATQPQDPAAHGRRKLAVALAAWAGLRHEGVPYAHEVGSPRLDATTMSDVARAPSMVEPHPEALAKLLSTMRQLDAALTAKGAFSPDSPAKQALSQLEELLVDALRNALLETACEPVPAIAWPKRIAALEARLGIAAASPRLAVVAVDASGRVLEEGTGPLDEAIMLLRPSDALVHPSVFVGAHVPHYEIASTLRRTDRAWAQVLDATPRAAYATPLFAPAKE